jgi:hypothetical protein
MAGASGPVFFLGLRLRLEPQEGSGGRTAVSPRRRQLGLSIEAEPARPAPAPPAAEAPGRTLAKAR